MIATEERRGGRGARGRAPSGRDPARPAAARPRRARPAGLAETRSGHAAHPGADAVGRGGAGGRGERTGTGRTACFPQALRGRRADGGGAAAPGRRREGAASDPMKKILVVDDEDDILHFLEMVLRGEGLPRDDRLGRPRGADARADRQARPGAARHHDAADGRLGGAEAAARGRRDAAHPGGHALGAHRGQGPRAGAAGRAPSTTSASPSR